jgi:hypothetical protein
MIILEKCSRTEEATLIVKQESKEERVSGKGAMGASKELHAKNAFEDSLHLQSDQGQN